MSANTQTRHTHNWLSLQHFKQTNQSHNITNLLAAAVAVAATTKLGSVDKERDDDDDDNYSHFIFIHKLSFDRRVLCDFFPLLLLLSFSFCFLSFFLLFRIQEVK